jgi:hypothetical protein
VHLASALCRSLRAFSQWSIVLAGRSFGVSAFGRGTRPRGMVEMPVRLARPSTKPYQRNTAPAD